MSSKRLVKSAQESFSKENRKILLNANITIKKNIPISIEITACSSSPDIYKNLNIKYVLKSAIPIEAKNHPLDAESVIMQIAKTSNTPYQFENIEVNLDDNVFLPKISMLNELRRAALEKVEDFAYANIIRKSDALYVSNNVKSNNISHNSPKISVLLNSLQPSFDYENLDKRISNIYIPLRYFSNGSLKNSIEKLMNFYNIYIYMPTILRSNYRNLLMANIENTLEKYDIKGFVVSNIGNLELFNKLNIDFSKYELVGNYTLNVFNNVTISNLKDLRHSQIYSFC